MAENTSEIIVGGAVLALAAGFMIYAGQVTGFARQSDNYSLHASFRSVEGIAVGTDVRLAGVKIGSVSGLNLNPQTYRAETTVTIPKDIQIPDDSSISIASEGLLGGNFVEIVPGGSLTYFKPGAEIEDTQGAVSLISLLMKFVTGKGQ